MSATKLLLLTCLNLLQILIYTQTGHSLDLKYKDCVEGCKRAHPRVQQRFSDYKLDVWCHDMDRWYKDLLKPRPQIAYSFSQRNYLKRVQHCTSSVECYGYKTKGKRNVALPPAIRKECRALSKSEFKEFTDALNKLKRDKIDGVSKYDLIISYHDPRTSPEAHFGPAFLPFHREYLKQLEVALRQLNPNVAICYWDSNLDEGLPKAWESVLWTPELFGNGNNSVTEGPFANWVVTTSLPGTTDKLIHRGVGDSDAWDLYKQEDFDFFLTKTRYQDLASYCTEPTFTVLHNSVHEFVGGHMIYTAISPNDPVFFLHHSFVDYFWEMWRLNKQSPGDRELDYPANGPVACSSQHYATAPMHPFPLQNVHGLRNNYTTLFQYKPHPTCESGCTGPYLFCDTDRQRCLSKIRPGGSCQGLAHFDACYQSKCVDDLCVKSNDDERSNETFPADNSGDRMHPDHSNTIDRSIEEEENDNLFFS